MQLKQGESRTLIGTFKTAGGAPIDLANYTVKCYIGTTSNRQIIQPAVILTGGNQFIIQLTSSDTTKLRPAVYQLEIWRFVGDKAVASQSASITIRQGLHNG